MSVRTEDDVLHLDNKELPTFGHVLSPSDSEKFIQFLTVPYIRIPLILDFFANGDPGRLSAMKAKSLQIIIDAALFEPGRWKPADFTDTVKEIPVKDFDRLEALLATAHGTLFNEIAKSPEVLTTCILKMLDRALDMDVGKYTKKSGLGVGRHVSDFVEEQRAAVGLFEPSSALLRRACKRALFMPKQLRFNQLAGNGCNIQRYEGHGPPRAMLM